jgi:hypothetical protein
VLQAVVDVVARLGLGEVSTGDLFEPESPDRARGADAADALMRALGVRRAAIDVADGGATLRTLDIDVPAAADRAVRLVVDATLPGGDWASGGHESASVAVWVDGTYHSDVVVTAERGVPAEVALAGLPPGHHTVELRAAPARSAPGAGPVAVRSVTTREVTGREALIDRHAPVLVLRTDEDGGPTQDHTDTPMLLVPVVSDEPGGGCRIVYHVYFSGEDGGTPTGELLSRWGRTADEAAAYTVRLDRDGRVLQAQYEGPLHQGHPYVADGRPVLRVSTRNNTFSARGTGTGPRWAPAPTSAPAGRWDDLAVLTSQPWAFALMGKELLREHPDVDARRYLFVGSISQAVLGALRAGTTCSVTTRDGRRVTFAARAEALAGAAALRLPDDLDPSTVVSARLGAEPGGARVWAVDATFVPRALAGA